MSGSDSICFAIAVSVKSILFVKNTDGRDAGMYVCNQKVG